MSEKYSYGGLIGYIILYVMIFTVTLGGIIFYMIPNFIIMILHFDILGLFINTTVWFILFVLTGIIMGVLSGLTHFIRKKYRKDNYIYNICDLLEVVYLFILVLLLLLNFSGGYATIDLFIDIEIVIAGIFYTFIGMATLIFIFILTILILRSSKFVMWLLINTGTIKGTLISKKYGLIIK